MSVSHLIKLTLHFPTEAIFNKPSTTSLLNYSSFRGISSVTFFSHRFTIKHWKWLTSGDRTMPLSVTSQYIAPEGKEENKFKLKMEFWPKGNKETDEKNVRIGIRNEGTQSVLLHWHFALLTETDEKCHKNGTRVNSMSHHLVFNICQLFPSVSRKYFTNSWSI